MTIAPLIAIIAFVLVKGLPTLNGQLIGNAAGNPTAPGALNAIVGSLQMVPLALLIGGGLGLLAGIYLAEFAGSRTRQLFGFVVDVLLGVPVDHRRPARLQHARGGQRVECVRRIGRPRRSSCSRS